MKDEFYCEKLDFENDTDSPALTPNKLLYIDYEYSDKKTIVSVKSVGIQR